MDSKNIIGIVVIVVVVVILGYFLFSRGKNNDGSYYQSPGSQIPLDSSANGNTNANGNSNVPSKATDVTIKNMAFGPAQVTVQKGATVKWTNQDSVVHTVTSDDNKFTSSGNLSNGGSYQFTFNTPGTYAYHCVLHPNMKGAVVVQ